MSALIDNPFLLFVLSLLLQWMATYVGRVARRRRPMGDVEREELVTVLNAALTLLALLIGFSLAMAVGRFDQRETYEEAESNAIGTAYLRADLLPPAAAAHVHSLLTTYARERISYFEERDPLQLDRIDAETARLQGELWDTIATAAAGQPTATMTLVVSSANEVIDSQGFTQASWSNRIPTAVWVLMLVVAVACNALLGRVETRVSTATLLVLPVLLSVSLFLIADIDSPRVGIISVVPNNLTSALHAMRPRPPPPAAAANSIASGSVER
jgi:hypothetical protein